MFAALRKGRTELGLQDHSGLFVRGYRMLREGSAVRGPIGAPFSAFSGRADPEIERQFFAASAATLRCRSDLAGSVGCFSEPALTYFRRGRGIRGGTTFWVG